MTDQIIDEPRSILIRVEFLPYGGFVLSEAQHENGALIENRMQACSSISDVRRALDDYVSEWHRVLLELERRHRDDIARPVTIPEIDDDGMPRIARREAEKPKSMFRMLIGGRS